MKPARLACSIVAGASVSLLVAGCPTRELAVQITSDGASTLVSGCESFRAACDEASCHENQFLCTQDTCVLKQACSVGNNPTWMPSVAMAMRLVVLDVSPNSLDIEVASACVPLNLRPCILDPTGVNGCPCITDPLGPVTCGADPTSEASYACIRDTMAEAVASAMGSGLTFSGFTSTDGIALAATLFVKPSGEASCSAPVLVNPSDCATANLTAVAGLGQTSDGSTYDITCASCQGGTHDAFGPDNAPCPTTTDECFLQRVATALQAAGY